MSAGGGRGEQAPLTEAQESAPTETMSQCVTMRNSISPLHPTLRAPLLAEARTGRLILTSETSES